MTFQLGKASLKELNGVHPKLVKVVQLAITYTTVDFGVHDGLRTKEEQKRLFDTGASKTMNSKHIIQASTGYGHAVDLVPYVNGKLRWEWPLIYPIAAAVAVAANEVGLALRWGGVWDKPMSAYLPKINDVKDLDEAAAAIKREVEYYCLRHPGPDFIDGPHYEIL